MLRDEIAQSAACLLEFCAGKPMETAVRYHVMLRLLDVPYADVQMAELRRAFLDSDIVNQLAREQRADGGWGALHSKDYTMKAVFPTSMTAINRCLYIGLTLYDERQILRGAQEYLTAFLSGTSLEKIYHKNERDVPSQTAEICRMLEAIQSYDSHCDESFAQWIYIAERAYRDGVYVYERDREVQHEVFGTKEKRLIPMQAGLLMQRREALPEFLEGAMLYHLGEHAYHHGHFWSECPERLPEQFVSRKTRRWLPSFHYINQFHGSAVYLSRAVEWLLESRDETGLWDYGTQIKDPWGYFGNFSTARGNRNTRVVDCTLEILNFLKRYADNNE